MKNKNGFTLVELIAIIIIIGIIIGIIAPTAIKLIEKSKVNSFREGLRSIIRSAEIYIVITSYSIHYTKLYEQKRLNQKRSNYKRSKLIYKYK